MAFLQLEHVSEVSCLAEGMNPPAVLRTVANSKVPLLSPVPDLENNSEKLFILIVFAVGLRGHPPPARGQTLQFEQSGDFAATPPPAIAPNTSGLLDINLSCSFHTEFIF